MPKRTVDARPSGPRPGPPCSRPGAGVRIGVGVGAVGFTAASAAAAARAVIELGDRRDGTSGRSDVRLVLGAVPRCDDRRVRGRGGPVSQWYRGRWYRIGGQVPVERHDVGRRRRNARVPAWRERRLTQGLALLSFLSVASVLWAQPALLADPTVGTERPADADGQAEKASQHQDHADSRDVDRRQLPGDRGSSGWRRPQSGGSRFRRSPHLTPSVPGARPGRAAGGSTPPGSPRCLTGRTRCVTGSHVPGAARPVTRK